MDVHLRWCLLAILLSSCASNRVQPGDEVPLTIVWGNFSAEQYAIAVIESDRPAPFVDHNRLEPCGSGRLEYRLVAPFRVLMGPDDGMGDIPLLFHSDEMPPRGDVGYLMNITATGEIQVLPLDMPDPPWGNAAPC
jgi:hypothetical protein